MLTEDKIMSMSSREMKKFVRDNIDNSKDLRVLALYRHLPGNILHLLYNTGDKTVQSYVIFHPNLPPKTAEQYVKELSSPYFDLHKTPKDTLFQIFQKMPTWATVKNLAKIITNKYPPPKMHPKTGGAQPNTPLNENDYQEVENFLLPYMLINPHTPSEYIQQKYDTADFTQYNKNNIKHPLNIITKHENTPPLILHNIALTPNTPPNGQHHIYLHETSLTQNIIENTNTTYDTLTHPKFLQKLESPSLAYTLLNHLPKHQQYGKQTTDLLVYGNTPHSIKKLLPLMPDHLQLTTEHITFLSLTYGYKQDL